MELVDTHCHIQSAGNAKGERTTRQIWAKDPALTGDKLIEYARAAGIRSLICVGCDLNDSCLAAEFAQRHNNCWASVGIHPHEADSYANQPDLLSELAALVSRPKVVAIGECGLDFYYQHSTREAQKAVLKFQIELALKNDLPVIFHVREAYNDFWPIFDNYQGLRGVMHSFTDSSENLHQGLARGLYVGVNGIATFTKDPAQLDVYRSIPLEKMVLETDSPFLTPTPNRGNINEPQQVINIADFIARLRGEELQNLAMATTTNAQKLFGI